MTNPESRRYDLLIYKDVPVRMSDGTVLRANVFRPDAASQFPVIKAKGAYGRDVHFRDGYRPQLDRLKKIYPTLDTEGTTGRLLRWETVDPERWVPEGCVVIMVQSRGSGKSPGYLDPYSPAETNDYAEAIDWAGVQPWSNGKVGLIDVFYFAIKQCEVAALQPKHLAAMIPWEGCCDFYREWSRHGGMRTRFPVVWWPRQILPNQHGNGANTRLDPDTGKQPNGQPLSAEMLEGNRASFPDDILDHVLDDEWYRHRTPGFDRITVPLLSAGNRGGPGLHLRAISKGFSPLPDRTNGCRCISAPISKASTCRTMSPCRSAFSTTISKISGTAGTMSLWSRFRCAGPMELNGAWNMNVPWPALTG